MLFNANDKDLFDLSVHSVNVGNETFMLGVSKFINEVLGGRPPDVSSYTQYMAINNRFQFNSSESISSTLYVSNHGAIGFYDIQSPGSSTSSTYAASLGGATHIFGRSRTPAFVMGMGVSGYNPSVTNMQVWYEVTATYIYMTLKAGVVTMHLFIQLTSNRIVVSYYNDTGGANALFHTNSYNTNRTMVTSNSAPFGLSAGIFDCIMNASIIDRVERVSEQFNIADVVSVSVVHAQPAAQEVTEDISFTFDNADVTVEDTSDATQISVSTTHSFNGVSSIIPELSLWGQKEGTAGRSVSLMLDTTKGIRNAPGVVTVSYNGDIGTLYGDGGYLPISTWEFTPTTLVPKMVPDIIVDVVPSILGSNIEVISVTDANSSMGRETVRLSATVIGTITVTDTGGSNV